KTLITVQYNTPTVRFWEIPSGKLLRTLVNSAPGTFAAAFSPDGRCLALGGQDRIVQLRHLEPVQEFDCLPGPAEGGEAWSLAFSPDGKILAAGYDDEAGRDQETLKLWDVATGQPLTTLAGHRGTVIDLAFAPGGKLLATASYDKTVKLWNVAQPTTPVTLT